MSAVRITALDISSGVIGIDATDAFEWIAADAAALAGLPESARAVAIRLLMKAATRLRSEGYWCTKLTISIKPMDDPPWSLYQNLEPCQCTVRLLHHLNTMWYHRQTEFVFAISVTLGGLMRDACVEQPLFPHERKLTDLAHTMDRINTKHGHAKIYYASMHDARKAAPRRIPFSTIPDLALPDHS